MLLLRSLRTCMPLYMSRTKSIKAVTTFSYILIVVTKMRVTSIWYPHSTFNQAHINYLQPLLVAFHDITRAHKNRPKFYLLTHRVGSGNLGHVVCDVRAIYRTFVGLLL